eukprot:scaffold1506_cov179-Amphora_coffeaeformis.AAC.27
MATLTTYTSDESLILWNAFHVKERANWKWSPLEKTLRSSVRGSWQHGLYVCLKSRRDANLCHKNLFELRSLVGAYATRGQGPPRARGKATPRPLKVLAPPDLLEKVQGLLAAFSSYYTTGQTFVGVREKYTGIEFVDNSLLLLPHLVPPTL